jgi:hypothetical protein
MQICNLAVDDSVELEKLGAAIARRLLSAGIWVPLPQRRLKVKGRFGEAAALA